MGLFRPKLSDADYYGSAAITYGQAIDAIQSSEVIDRHRAMTLHSDLLTIASTQMEAMIGEKYFTDLYTHHFPEARVRSDTDQVQFFLLNNDDLITQMGSSLTAAFQSQVTRDEALLIGVKHVERLSKHLPQSTYPSTIQECGYCIGLAMKTIIDGDRGNKTKIARQQIVFGAIVAANWSAVVLADPDLV